MIFARAGLGQAFGELDQIRRRDRADFLAHPLAQFGQQCIGALLARVQRDVAIYALPLDIMRVSDHCGFGHLGMQHQRAFDLAVPIAVARDIDDVIHRGP